MVIQWGFLAVVLFCGGCWVYDHYVFDKKRVVRGKKPWILDYCSSFFWVLLILFLLRSFIVEPFRIPTGSMEPTIKPGDLVLINKLSYLRSEIQRGDIVVFQYPKNEEEFYIKRVIAKAGDSFSIEHNKVWVNGQPLDQKKLTEPCFKSLVEGGCIEVHREITYKQQEDFLEVPFAYRIGLDPEAGRLNYATLLKEANMDSACVVRKGGFAIKCRVPDGMVFTMGDNRNQSSDSRFFGFVKNEKVVGKAQWIVFALNQWRRIGGLY